MLKSQIRPEFELYKINRFNLRNSLSPILSCKAYENLENKAQILPPFLYIYAHIYISEAYSVELNCEY